MDSNELEEDKILVAALLGYIKVLQTSLSLAGPRVPTFVALDQENTKLRDTIDRQNETISELSKEVLDLKRRLSAHTGEPS